MAYKTVYNPGDFNHTIELQSFSEVTNEMGMIEEQWTTTRKVRCMARNNLSTSRMEFFKAAGVNITTMKEFIIRYKNEFDSKNTRLIYKNEIYNIIKVDNIDEESFYQRISAKLVE